MLWHFYSRTRDFSHIFEKCVGRKPTLAYIAAADEKIEAVMVNDGEVSMPVRQSPSTYELASRMPSRPHATLPDADPCRMRGLFN